MTKRKATENATATHAQLTPLWQFMDIVERRGNGTGNCKVKCKFCKLEWWGSYTRVKAHLLKIKGFGSKACSSIDPENFKKLQKMQEVADALAEMTSSGVADIPLPNADNFGVKVRRGDGGMSNLFNTSARDQLDHMLARAFFGCGIPFNVMRSPLFREAIQFAADNSLKGYIPPTADRLRTSLLDDEVENMKKLLEPVRRSWRRAGTSIISDGWTDNNRRPLINFMASSGNGPVFLKAIDTTGNIKDAQYIASLFLDVIEEVGASNIVQIVTDNAPVMKSSAQIVEERHPHISWTPCVVHTLNLGIKDLCEPKQNDLSRLEHCNWIKDLIAEARTIKVFVQNHSHATALYKKYSALQLLSIADTRFASNIIMLTRLYEVKSSLLSMVVDEEWKFYKGEDSKKAQMIKNFIVDDDWWENIRYLLLVVKPVMNMLRSCDTDKPNLHLVYDKWDAMIEKIRLIIFGHENLNILTDSSPFYTEVHDIFVSRWNKSHTPLICLAHSLNPKYYSDEWLEGGSGLGRVPPHRDDEISMGRNTYFERLFINPEERRKVKDEYGKFSGCIGSFANWESQRDRFTEDASAWWNNYGAAAPTLARLADKLMNQPCSSSCCERNWSTYGFIQSVKRNHLDPERAEDLVQVHTSLRLLGRKEDSYLKGPTKYWDVFVDNDSMEGPSELEMANMEMMEPVVHPPLGEDTTH